MHDVFLSWLCMFSFYVYCFSCFSRFSERGEGRLAPGKTKYKCTTYGEDGLHLVGRLAPGRSGAQARHAKYLSNQQKSRPQRFFVFVVHDVFMFVVHDFFMFIVEDYFILFVGEVAERVLRVGGRTACTW